MSSKDDNFANAAANAPLMDDGTPVVGKKDVEFGVNGDGGEGEVRIIDPDESGFIGLSKDELERYATDPFWVRLRMALFGLFWLAWIAMFVIAIVLVIIAPKCPDKPVRHWWQKKVCYQIYTRSYQDSDGDGIGDLNGIKSQLKNIRRMNIQTVWPVGVTSSADGSGYAVLDHSAVDSTLGTEEDFTSLVSAVHTNKMHMIIDLMPTASSQAQFDAWPAAERNDAYLKGVDGEYKKWNGRPVLNFENPAVKKKAKESLIAWLGRGVDGFYLFTKHLGMDDKGVKDSSKALKMIDEIRGWINTWKNETGEDREILLMAQAEGDKAFRDVLLGSNSTNLVIQEELKKADANSDAKWLHETIATEMEYHIQPYEDDADQSWPMWEFGSPYTSRIATRLVPAGSAANVSSAVAELYTALLLVLPGSVNMYYGDEIAMRDVPVDKFTATDDEIKTFLSSKDNPAAFDADLRTIKATLQHRTPMQWSAGANAGFSTAEKIALPLNDDYKTNNFELLYKDQNSASRLIRRLSGLRARDDTFLFGQYALGSVTNGVLTMARTPNEEIRTPTFIAAFNFDREKSAKVNILDDTTLMAEVNKAEPQLDSATVVEMTMNMDHRNVYTVRSGIDLKEVDLQPLEGIVIKLKA